MEIDEISEIGIDENERLYIKPSKSSFTMIYREAMELGWDKDGGFLFSPKPRKWGYIDWYQQILKGASSQGTSLQITDETVWLNIDANLKKQIQGCGNVAT
jgi:hypothetical protein